MNHSSEAGHRSEGTHCVVVVGSAPVSTAAQHVAPEELPDTLDGAECVVVGTGVPLDEAMAIAEAVAERSDLPVVLYSDATPEHLARAAEAPAVTAFVAAAWPAADRLLGATLERVVDHQRALTELARRDEQIEFFHSLLRHDVLNAMTVVHGTAHLLLETAGKRHPEDADLERDLRTIVAWSEDTIDVVGRVRHILDTLTDGREYPLEGVRLRDALLPEVERLRATGDVDVTADVPDLTVRADDLLPEVFGTVLSNAVEHSDRERPHVEVVATPVGRDRVSVVVADDGPGVPDSRKHEVFSREAAGHVKRTGSGFGLVFVDSVVQRYGGSVTVTDNHPRGAEFRFDLPAWDGGAA